MLVSAHSFHAKSSSIVVSVGPWEIEHQTTRSQMVVSYIRMLIQKNKHRPEFVSLLVVFMEVGEAKFAVIGCNWLYWNSWKWRKLEKMAGAQNLSISCDSQPRNWEGKKMKEGKTPIPATRISLLLTCQKPSLCSSGQRR